MFKKYTQCYKYLAHPYDKPFNSKDLLMVASVHAILAFTLLGSFTITGLIILGPVGAAVGAVIGFFVGITSGVATALHSVSDQWRFHRLVCLANEPKCAVGTVSEGPEISDLGTFDNDEYFDLILMPHRVEDNYVTLTDPTNPNSDPPKYGTVANNQHIIAHPKNEIYRDGFQGEWYLHPNQLFLPPNPNLGYNDHKKDPKELHTASMLHCEAEGDFWVRMKNLAIVLGLLVALLAAAAVAGAAGGAAAGAAAGCALGAWFFGPIGCLIGSILGGILGASAVGAVGGLILYGILKLIFDANPGEVEDANVGDKNLGEIKAGSRVAVLGEHVYDGFHDGWHEFHPLMAVIKIEADTPSPEATESAFLTWNPQFPDGGRLPMPPSGMPEDGLTVEDMRHGLDSDKFRKRAEWLHNQWCAMLTTAYERKIRETQQALTYRWTIHPLVDGCRPVEEGVEPIPPIK